ncbi:nicotinate-nucleotide--dimethylbenzimidazole phosphoribosyltransferase [Empedobacter sp. 225-1]|uniref:nicotinate-nucleotide--dimethylbenzimidazole phosphoribosyltransferase n=1 Tax=unclassified Empedobacter TaxID=2643773 RepID=UPI002578D600|nr:MULTISPECIES: nicotinate-nucleotide--dimethylbenzimidazole phosphoribosyltransferase [unclassified Empedobacter]MDM1522977.1 nicotinate-nucleotide--dimethylbenzimidazole phosphoribosyltransferase [Empedobacter sp. 225-1]MDM1542957.1 nicotinate-nucleotide--dimethylbenzimidazole phosphoribosyltransferase [Empedobacter sp. 189-2]
MLKEEIQHLIDLKTKPLGALGLLEKIALKIGLVQQKNHLELVNPHLIVFASDHGIAQSGISAYPAEVTPQMVINFLNNGAAINVFCNQNEIDLTIVDAGVNYDFADYSVLKNCKVAKSTKNFLYEPAMNAEKLQQCFDHSKKIVDEIAQNGTNIIGFGEMGIGNTSSASMIIHYLTQLPLEQCVGRGTGLNDEQLQNKINILTQAKENQGEINDPKQILATFGGFEVAQMTGAMLAAYEHNMLLMIDGYIASAAILVASKLKPEILKNAIFCHQSDEIGHRYLLNYFNEEPILKINLRVGEGTGCALAYPIIKSAVNFFNDMASFESAGVSNKETEVEC